MAERITTEKRKLTDVKLDDTADPVTDFVNRLERTAEGLRKPLFWIVAHGKRRSRSEMRIAREQREGQLRTVKDALEILKSGRELEVEFFKDNAGKIRGFKVDSN